jgi:hypothetical protein
VDKAYYSVPPEHTTRQVWVRWDSRLVRIFNRRMQQIALHGKHEPGRFSTQRDHIHTEKITTAERGTTYLLTKARSIGPQTALWAEAMLAARGVAGVRVLVGLLNLARLHSCELIEKACAVAVTYPATPGCRGRQHRPHEDSSATRSGWTSNRCSLTSCPTAGGE